MAREDRPTTFNRDARKRIADATRRVERMPYGAGEDGGAGSRHIRADCFAMKATYGANCSSDTDWTIYSRGTAARGSEVATSVTSFPLGVYIREGHCYPSVLYKLVELDGGFEVLNPTLRMRGISDAGIAVDATGTVSIYYRTGATTFTDTTVNATCLNDLDVAVPSAADVQCVWEAYGTTAGWTIIQTDFSC